MRQRAAGRADRTMEPLQGAIHDPVIANLILAHHAVFNEYGLIPRRQ